MFASTISSDRCQLYTVVRTDLLSWDREVLTYPPTDYMTAVARSLDYQRQFDPSLERYDYRVAMCD